MIWGPSKKYVQAQEAGRAREKEAYDRLIEHLASLPEHEREMHLINQWGARGGRHGASVVTPGGQLEDVDWVLRQAEQRANLRATESHYRAEAEQRRRERVQDEEDRERQEAQARSRALRERLVHEQEDRDRRAAAEAEWAAAEPERIARHQEMLAIEASVVAWRAAEPARKAREERELREERAAKKAAWFARQEWERGAMKREQERVARTLSQVAERLAQTLSRVAERPELVARAEADTRRTVGQLVALADEGLEPS